ncbi:hypothetical protein C5C31_13590 [Rathayibacter rathayi]|uniref:DoxX family membrane protein n=1 Tax=Rathayibacter rathayi TaxID=33887 RepID=A0ABD6W6K7_RATRA|nr:hypothetical protein [Rathayibacter rathayi]AZZ47779.1 hypothetical protein C1O28_00020 [Rathayibacter rathayi]AZZ50313.1 hypothetical protein C1O28_14845 [Rathayibacter rathayi]MWV75030.1 hypothetical protein [Rathayibacter rathayi NCPPB 2980 = VKM Ac-1601]PPF11505.1 hypothetical protein C5C04_11965 [Rathayibacter rathayi]PPF20946.1 hypothetical protein C5C34_13705 [Rathayibacter rathayi]
MRTFSSSLLRAGAKVLLGSILVFAGVNHLTRKRQEFQAQVPEWVPLDKDAVVLASGVVEIGLGAALVLARRRAPLVGAAAAAFFTAIFPGNISQWRTHTSAFGLDTDRKRAVRLVFQPLLVVWALWSTRRPRG